MHLAGVKERITLRKASASPAYPAQCLLQQRWDFAWQRSYSYATTAIESLPVLEVGDQIEIECTYDNTLGNAPLAAALAAEGVPGPVPIGLGEGTLDETCGAALTLIQLAD
jgi:hypothetical protein